MGFFGDLKAISGNVAQQVNSEYKTAKTRYQQHQQQQQQKFQQQKIQSQQQPGQQQQLPGQQQVPGQQGQYVQQGSAYPQQFQQQQQPYGQGVQTGQFSQQQQSPYINQQGQYQVQGQHAQQPQYGQPQQQFPQQQQQQPQQQNPGSPYGQHPQHQQPQPSQQPQSPPQQYGYNQSAVSSPVGGAQQYQFQQGPATYSVGSSQYVVGNAGAGSQYPQHQYQQQPTPSPQQQPTPQQYGYNQSPVSSFAAGQQHTPSPTQHQAAPHQHQPQHGYSPSVSSTPGPGPQQPPTPQQQYSYGQPQAPSYAPGQQHLQQQHQPSPPQQPSTPHQHGYSPSVTSAPAIGAQYPHPGQQQHPSPAQQQSTPQTPQMYGYGQPPVNSPPPGTQYMPPQHPPPGNIAQQGPAGYSHTPPPTSPPVTQSPYQQPQPQAPPQQQQQAYAYNAAPTPPIGSQPPFAQSPTHQQAQQVYSAPTSAPYGAQPGYQSPPPQHPYGYTQSPPPPTGTPSMHQQPPPPQQPQQQPYGYAQPPPPSASMGTPPVQTQPLQQSPPPSQPEYQQQQPQQQSPHVYSPTPIQPVPQASPEATSPPPVAPLNTKPAYQNLPPDDRQMLEQLDEQAERDRAEVARQQGQLASHATADGTRSIAEPQPTARGIDSGETQGEAPKQLAEQVLANAKQDAVAAQQPNPRQANEQEPVRSQDVIEAQKLEAEARLEQERQQQSDKDRAMAQRLSVQYQTEYDQNLRQTQEEMDRLNIGTGPAPPMPLRSPDSQTSPSAPQPGFAPGPPLEAQTGSNVIPSQPPQVPATASSTDHYDDGLTSPAQGGMPPIQIQHGNIYTPPPLPRANQAPQSAQAPSYEAHNANIQAPQPRPYADPSAHHQPHIPPQVSSLSTSFGPHPSMGNVTHGRPVQTSPLYRADSVQVTLGYATPTAAGGEQILSMPTVEEPESELTSVTECVDTTVAFELEWYIHPAALEFTVCSYCYVQHIYNTRFRDEFKAITLGGDDKPRKCMFGTPRAKDGLFPAAVSSGNLGPLFTFMQTRQQLPHCPEASGVEGHSWLSTAEMPGMEFCPACYEDAILATPFGSKFTASTPGGKHVCDFVILYNRRMFELHGTQTGDWTALVTEVNARAQMPPCPKSEAIEPSKRTWFASKRGPQGMNVCLVCFVDMFHGTPNAECFEQRTLNVPRTQCATGNLNMLIPAQETLKKKDWGLFWRAVQGVAANPYCEPTGIKGATWYTLPNDPLDFGVCGACKAGILEPLGAANHFVPKQVPPGTESLACCFNLGHKRSTSFLKKLSETILKDTSQPLCDFAAKFAAVPPCTGIRRGGTNQRWWGWDELSICEDCHLTFAQGSPLESNFALRGERQADERICDLWSPRMRGMFRDAEAKGSSGDEAALGELLKFAQYRQQVFLETVPMCEQLLQQHKLAATQAKMLGIMGTTYSAMGGAADAVQGHGYTVGNSYVGHGYGNEMLLQGAVYNKQSLEATAAMTSGGPMAQIAMLEGRWKTVE